MYLCDEAAASIGVSYPLCVACRRAHTCRVCVSVSCVLCVCHHVIAKIGIKSSIFREVNVQRRPAPQDAQRSQRSPDY